MIRESVRYVTFWVCGNISVNNKTGKEFSINYNLDCNSSNVVYLISCKKCNVQYVESTTTRFRTRFNNQKSRARVTRKSMNLDNYSLSLLITIVAKR